MRCVLALHACVRVGQSFAAPPQLLPLVVATRCSVLAAYDDTIETDMRLGRNGYNGS